MSRRRRTSQSGVNSLSRSAEGKQVRAEVRITCVTKTARANCKERLNVNATLKKREKILSMTRETYRENETLPSACYA